MRVAVGMVLSVLASGLAACGGGGSGGGAQSCTPGLSTTVSFSDTGFANGANNACVEPGGQVTFTNTGSSAHNVIFDTAGCGATTVPVPANNGQASLTVPPTLPSSGLLACNFHLDTGTPLSGTIAVSNAVQSGGGY